MADKDETEGKKRKSRIASLDLKNYKAKYTDSYGLGKPNEIDLDNFLIAEPDKSEEKISEPVESSQPQPVEKNEPVKSSQPVEKNIEPKISEPPKIEKIEKPIEKPPEIKTKSEIKKVDEDYEKRVYAEAENDFFDETPIKDNGTFRAKNIVKKSSGTIEKENNEKPKRKLNLREPVKVNVRHEIRDRKKFEDEELIEESAPIKEPPRRTETYGIVLSAVALIYSVIAKDKPLVFLSVSLLLYLLRSIISAPFGKYSHSIENAIKGFSIAVFFGAIFFIFF